MVVGDVLVFVGVGKEVRCGLGNDGGWVGFFFLDF